MSHDNLVSAPAVLIRDAPGVFIDGSGYPTDFGGEVPVLCIF